MKKIDKKIIDTKVRAKGYKSALARHKNKKRKELIILITIITLFILVFIFMNSAFVKVKNININGLNQIDKTELISASQLREELKIWQVEEAKIENEIKEKYNIISEIKVQKELLNTINIDIKEKKVLAQELNQQGEYVKLLEDGTEYHGKMSKKHILPVISGFTDDKDKKLEVLKNLSEINVNVLYKISEIALNKDDKNIANIYMQDGQKIKVTLSNFSSKLNYYLQIEKHIENKNNTILNLVNGAYLETNDSVANKENKIKQILNESIAVNTETETTTSTKTTTKTSR